MMLIINAGDYYDKFHSKTFVYFTCMENCPVEVGVQMSSDFAQLCRAKQRRPTEWAVVSCAACAASLQLRETPAFLNCYVQL